MMKNIKKKEREFKQEALPLEMLEGDLDHHLRCPSIHVPMHVSLIMT